MTSREIAKRMLQMKLDEGKNFFEFNAKVKQVFFHILNEIY